MAVHEDQQQTAEVHDRDYSRLRMILNDVLAGASGLSLPESLKDMAETARSLVGCAYAAVIVRDEVGELTHFVPLGVSGDAAEQIGRLPSDGGLLGEVINGGRVLRVPDIAVERGAIGLPANHPPIQELLGVPIRASGEVTGGLFLSAPADGVPFNLEDEHAARIVATAAGFLVDRDRASERAEREHHWLTTSTELTRELLAGVHADPMQVLVDRVLSVADADLAIVVMPSADGRSIVTTSVAGERADVMRHRVFARAGSMTDAVIASGKPMIVHHLSDSDEHPVFVEQVGADSALLVPMSEGEAKRGTLVVLREPGRRPFTETEVDMASTFAAQMVLALELAEAQANRERAGLFAERGRIARDLHDHVIQQLFAVGMTLQATADQVNEVAGERLQGAVDDLDATIMQIRSTIYRLSGPLLADQTLRSQAEHVVRELEPVVGFPVDFEVRGPIDFGVDDVVSSDVIAVLREAITNAAKHAHANHVRVALVVDGSGLVLTVADDGHGIGDASRRSGLANMRARAALHAGSMDVDTGDQGTTITWSIPRPTGD